MENTRGVKLEPKLIDAISGKFFIPSYQRGYRWDKEQVEQLLDDIYENGTTNYCLQPIVVKNNENVYELIDGQQRLTTLFIVLNYIKMYMPLINVNFSLSYETRPNSAIFLNNINEKEAEENIDYYHIFNAYKVIEAWFTKQSNPTHIAQKIYGYLCESVKVIWYETNEDEDSTDLFTRLNIGKIPLTNAELVRALFLSKDNQDALSDEEQLEIATSWDYMERVLHNEELWGFLTNKKANRYSTRIELIFDMMAEKQENEKEKYFTFYFFSNKVSKEQKSLKEIWSEVQSYYLRLKEWFDNRDVYHKVGYLVATGTQIQTLLNEAHGKKKSVFMSELDGKIKQQINISAEQIESLSYENGAEKTKIENILLLFNVETIRQLQNSDERYSFNTHKSKQWSLEHIHAQNSQGLNNTASQQEWLTLHLNSLKQITQIDDSETIQELIEKIEANYNNINGVVFNEIFGEVTTLLSEKNAKQYLHSFSNMALLSFENNAALNNSTFDVKRNKILEMDNLGQYIPICTKRVFFKYYTKSQNHQLHFWGESDRKAYMDAIIGESGVLLKYLNQD